MKNRYTILLILVLFLSTQEGFSQQFRGTYSFLDATNSPRVAALGGSMIPINDADIQLGLYNPSLINSLTDNKLSLSYVDYYSDINFASVQYAHNFEKIGNFMGTIQFHNYGSFDYATESGEQSGTFSASDYNVAIGWGRQLDSCFSIGANFKIVGTQYESYGSLALAVDVAGSYQSKTGWLISLTARNIGTELKSNISNDRSALPFSMQIGVSKRLKHVPFLFMIVYDNIQKWDLTYDDPLDLEGNYDPLTGEMNEKSNFAQFGDNLLRHFVIGGEVYIGKNIVLRGSYNYKRRHEMTVPDKLGMVGFSWGVGVRISKFQINYARSAYHIIGSPNYVSISTNLNSFKK